VFTRSTIAVAALAALASVAPQAASAHGAMEAPLSRVYLCYKEGPEQLKNGIGSPPCVDLVAMSGTQPLYDWMEVNRMDADGHHKRTAVDGHLCSGGREKYYGLDQRRGDWRTTTIRPDQNGKFTFRFHAWTPHATKYFRFYVTRDGWRPTDELRWSDLERFGAVAEPRLVNGYYEMRVRLPEGKTGRRLIYAVWQRSDSMEAFYSCSDVKIAGPKSGAAADSRVYWDEAGRAVARNDLPAGSIVAFRVFDAKGRDVERHVVELTEETGAAALWPHALAERVNDRSAIFRIGIMDREAIVPTKTEAGNIVYRSENYEGYSYTIDIDTK
jgi:chitin-binding protein